MSQVAAKRKLALRNESVKVVARFREQGSVLGGTQRGTAESFSIEVSLDSDGPKEEVIKLIRQAHRMCFTEHALSDGVPLSTSHRLNGGAIEADFSE